MLLDSTRNIVGQPNVKLSFAILEDVDAIRCRHAARRNWFAGAGFEPAVPQLRDYVPIRPIPVNW